MYDIHGARVRDGWHVIRLGDLLISVYAHRGYLHCAIASNGLLRWGTSGLQRDA